MDQLIFCIQTQDRFHKQYQIKKYIAENDVASITVRNQMIASINNIAMSYSNLIETDYGLTQEEKKVENEDFWNCIPLAVYIMDRFLSKYMPVCNAPVSQLDPSDSYFISIGSIVLASKWMLDSEISYKEMMYICAPLEGPFTIYKNYTGFVH